MNKRTLGSKKSTLLILLTMLAPLAVISCGDSDDGSPVSRPVAVRVAKPIITDMQSRLTYMGTVHANREVRVIAQVQGTVMRLPKLEGASIITGDLVAEIDVPDLRANVERLTAERDYWCRRHESDQRLVQAEALPQEQAEASLRACRSAKAALAEVEARLAKANEISSINGRVLSWLVEPGQHVMPGQPILLLGDDDLEIHVEVVEEDLQRGVIAGTPVEVQYQRGGNLQSTVAEVAPVASGPGRTFTVELPMPLSGNHREELRIGSSMHVEFILAASKNAQAVPVEAVARQGDRSHIFLIQHDRAIKQEVTTGIEQEGWIEVGFPWNGEDLVAVSNLGSLKDSVAVFPVEVEYDTL